MGYESVIGNDYNVAAAGVKCTDTSIHEPKCFGWYAAFASVEATTVEEEQDRGFPGGWGCQGVVHVELEE